MSHRVREETASQVVVVGSNPVAVDVAQTVTDPVSVVGFDRDGVRRLDGHVRETTVVEQPDQFSVPPGQPDVAILAADTDSANLLSAQKLRCARDLDVVVRLNDPDHQSAFDDLDVETVDVVSAVSETILDAYASRLGLTE